MENVFLSKLTELMASNNISRKDLANSIDVSYRAVSDYFNNDVIPRKQTLEKIAQLFNVPVSYLVPSDGEPSNKNLGIPFYFQGMTKESFHNLDKDNAGFLPLTFHDLPYVAAFLVRDILEASNYKRESIKLLDFNIDSDLPSSLPLLSLINDYYLIKYKNDSEATVMRVEAVIGSGLLLIESENSFNLRRTVEASDVQILARVIGSLNGVEFMTVRKTEDKESVFARNNLTSKPKKKIIFTEWHPTHLELEDSDSFISHNEKVRLACSEYMSDFFNNYSSHQLISFEFKSRTQKIYKKDQEVLFGIRIWYSYPIDG